MISILQKTALAAIFAFLGIMAALTVAIIARGILEIKASNAAIRGVDAYIAESPNKEILLAKTARYVYGEDALLRDSGLTESEVQIRLQDTFALTSNRHPSGYKGEPGEDFIGARRGAAAIATAQMRISESESPIGERVIKVKLPFVLLINTRSGETLGIDPRTTLADPDIIDPYLHPQYAAGAERGDFQPSESHAQKITQP